MSCNYCDHILSVEKSTEEDDRGFDEVLLVGPGVVVTPTIGTFITGHLLVISSIHTPGFACVPNASLSEIQVFLSVVMSQLSRIFGSYCIFEHGVGLRDSRQNSGQTVDHAHFHLIPINALIDESIRRGQDWTVIESLSDVKCYQMDGYLFYSFQGNFFVCSSVEVQSQWIRRTVFDCLPSSEKHWDWKVYPGRAEMEETKLLLKRIVR